MRTIGKVTKQTAAPVRRAEVAAATAIFREAFGEVAVTDEILARPDARHLRAATARNALDGTIYPPRERFWLRVRRFFRP
jgi:hypothetical protein